MITPAEKALRAALARFAAARIEHDVLPTGRTSCALEEATYTLCAITGARTAAEALVGADTMLRRLTAGRGGRQPSAWMPGRFPGPGSLGGTELKSPVSMIPPRDREPWGDRCCSAG